MLYLKRTFSDSNFLFVFVSIFSVFFLFGLKSHYISWSNDTSNFSKPSLEFFVSNLWIIFVYFVISIISLYFLYLGSIKNKESLLNFFIAVLFFVATILSSYFKIYYLQNF